jgi:hypothetical protein
MVQRDGVSESFERFFAATRDHVYRSLLVITRDQALADDGWPKPTHVHSNGGQTSRTIQRPRRGSRERL